MNSGVQKNTDNSNTVDMFGAVGQGTLDGAVQGYNSGGAAGAIIGGASGLANSAAAWSESAIQEYNYNNKLSQYSARKNTEIGIASQEELKSNISVTPYYKLGGELRTNSNKSGIVQGKSHENGGVKTTDSSGRPVELEGGEFKYGNYIYTKRMSINGKTFAQHAKTLSDEKDKLAKNITGKDKFNDNDSNLKIAAIEAELEELFNTQGTMNGGNNGSRRYALGGDLDNNFTKIGPNEYVNYATGEKIDDEEHFRRVNDVKFKQYQLDAKNPITNTSPVLDYQNAAIKKEKYDAVLKGVEERAAKREANVDPNAGQTFDELGNPIMLKPRVGTSNSATTVVPNQNAVVTTNPTLGQLNGTEATNLNAPVTNPAVPGSFANTTTNVSTPVAIPSNEPSYMQGSETGSQTNADGATRTVTKGKATYTDKNGNPIDAETYHSSKGSKTNPSGYNITSMGVTDKDGNLVSVDKDGKVNGVTLVTNQQGQLVPDTDVPVNKNNSPVVPSSTANDGYNYGPTGEIGSNEDPTVSGGTIPGNKSGNGNGLDGAGIPYDADFMAKVDEDIMNDKLNTDKGTGRTGGNINSKGTGQLGDILMAAGSITGNMLLNNRLKKQQLPTPTETPKVNLQRKKNYAAIQNANNEYEKALNYVEENTSNSNVARAQAGRLFAKKINADNQTYDALANANVDIANKEVMIDHQGSIRDNTARDKYNQDVYNKHIQTEITNPSAIAADAFNKYTNIGNNAKKEAYQDKQLDIIAGTSSSYGEGNDRLYDVDDFRTLTKENYQAELKRNSRPEQAARRAKIIAYGTSKGW